MKQLKQSQAVTAKEANNCSRGPCKCYGCPNAVQSQHRSLKPFSKQGMIKSK